MEGADVDHLPADP